MCFNMLFSIAQANLKLKEILTYQNYDLSLMRLHSVRTCVYISKIGPK